MKLKEFLNRNLLINEDKKVFDQDCNEYRDENGMMQHLDVSNEVAVELIRCQVEDNEGISLIENPEEYK